MLAFPNAKINCGLHVLFRREDGYHELETLLVPVGWRDALEIIPSPDGKFAFTQTGIRIYGAADSNLCVKAWHLMQARHSIGPVHMHLHKVIPTGAGLGGGSADAAFALRMLNELFRLHLSGESLETLAAELGSDCAFFIRNETRLALGRGERFRTVTTPTLPPWLIIVKPKTGVSTADAYKHVEPAAPPMPLTTILQLPPGQWKKQLKNDFEPSVFRKHPSLLRIREKLYTLGAVYASLSGSGSAVYGLFEKPVDARSRFRGNTVWQGNLSPS